MAELPPEAAAVIERAKAVIAATEACDREAERHPSSRSSAPMIRYINAMKRLRESIVALDPSFETAHKPDPIKLRQGSAMSIRTLRAECPAWHWTAKHDGTSYDYIGKRGNQQVTVRAHARLIGEDEFETEWRVHTGDTSISYAMWWIGHPQYLQTGRPVPS